VSYWRMMKRWQITSRFIVSSSLQNIVFV
jgi:hypothetical protein